jgi:membrane protein DedA with SNARE-associated domain
MLAEVVDHAERIVFVLVLANQAGLPVFAAPALLGVGALAASGDLDVASVATVAIGAALGADLAWYGLGRWRGAWALAALRRFQGGTGAFVDHAQRLFLAYDRAFQVGARFLPELNPVAAAFAGAARIKLTRFVVGAVMSAAIWAGAWIGAGYAIGGAIHDGRGSGMAFLAAVVVAVVVTLLSVVFRPAIRATVVAWLSRRCGERAPVTNPRPVDAVVAAGSRQGSPTAEGEAQPWT